MITLPKLGRYIYSFFYLKQWKLVLATKVGNRKIVFQPPPDRYWADPFPVEHGGDLYIFFEEHVEDAKGQISVLRVNKDTYEITRYYNNILNCQYHLSYPFVFDVDGTYYMMPESNKNRTLDLFKCISWPDKWEKEKTLLDDVVLSDSTLLYKDNLWWLFTTLNKTGEYADSINNLHLYYSKDIFTDPLTPHRHNPVKKDVASSRCAGYIYAENDTLYRPAQDCSDIYGGGLVINRIDKLYIDEFSEVETMLIGPDAAQKQIGVHTYNKSADYAVLDYLYNIVKIKLAFKTNKRYNKNKSFVKRYASYPAYSNGNSFITLLNDGMADEGWTVEGFNLHYGELYRNRLRVNILYFHWPESIWRSNNVLVSVVKAFRFTLLITFAKAIGYKTAWSAHNTMPHKYKSRRIERMMRKFILNRFDLIINHSRNAKQEQLEAFGKTGKRSVDAIHGHYDNYYKPEGKITRESLNIPNDHKIIYLNYNGQDYKGCDDFINSHIKHNNARVTLVISGSGSSKKYKPVPGIIFINKFLEEGELADILTMADMVSLPYKKITTSGFYFLALTFKKGILARNLPFFQLHSSANTILLYNNDDELQTAYTKIEDGWQPDITEVDTLLDQFTWAESTANIAEQFNELIK